MDTPLELHWELDDWSLFLGVVDFFLSEKRLMKSDLTPLLDFDWAIWVWGVSVDTLDELLLICS